MARRGSARKNVTGLGALSIVFLAGGALRPLPAAEPARWIRGDVAQDGSLTLTDSITLLEYLFLGTPERLLCEDSADLNDDGAVDIDDAVAGTPLPLRGMAPAPRALSVLRVRSHGRRTRVRELLDLRDRARGELRRHEARPRPCGGVWVDDPEECTAGTSRVSRVGSAVVVTQATE
jgi:hypothetical protein